MKPEKVEEGEERRSGVNGRITEMCEITKEMKGKLN